MNKRSKTQRLLPNRTLRSLLLIIAIMSTLTSYAVKDYDFYIGGIYYKKISNSAVGVSRAYTEGSNYYSGDIIIPESVTYQGNSYTVTTIRGYAFRSCTGLTSVSVPNSVSTIENIAFDGCTSLQSISLPSVISIDYYAFRDCSALTSVDLGNSLVSIGNSAFNGCVALTILDLPNSLKTIGDNAFSNCAELTSISIPDSVESIGSSAFSGCSNLTAAIIGNSVVSIGDYAFSGCVSLSFIEIGSSLVSIGSNALDDTSWFNNQPEGVVYAGSVAYKYKGVMPSGTSITIKEGTLGIASWAFYNCDGLTNITLPNSLLAIGNDAFCSCTSLSDIYFPPSLTTIGDGAFILCNSLTSIEIPSSVVSIGRSCFAECKGLTDVTLPNTITSISQGMFSFCSSLSSVNIPSSVTTISSESFRYCTSLPNINLPNSVTKIQSHAFEGCSSLSEINIPSSVTAIYSNAFGECNALKKVEITNLESWCKIYFEMPMGDERCNPCTYAHHLFLNGEEITDLVIPNTITSIRGAFCGCSNIASVTIPSSVTYIGDCTFEGCSALTSFTIPGSVTYIGASAFWGCNSLTSVTCLAATPPTINYTSTWPYIISNQTTLYVPVGKRYIYQNATNWNKFLSYEEVVIIASSINLDTTEINIILGESHQLIASVLPNETTNNIVSWASSNPNVATVSSSGLVNTVGLGTATIVAMTTDGSNLAATCLVTVVDPNVPGDVNGDDRINISDVTALIDFLLSDDDSHINRANSDVNGDGRINISDVTSLIDILLTQH